jgi:hypothetical protein
MEQFYFYVYLLAVIVSTMMFTISRCYFDIHIFDNLFYPNENDNILKNNIFLIFHISVNFLLGLLFGFDVIYGMILKIIFFEVYLYFTQYCDIFKTAKFSHLVVIVIISLASFLVGCMLSQQFNNLLSKM